MNVLHRVYQFALSADHPTSGKTWLRRHRLLAISLMAIAAWALVAGTIWLIWVVLF